ncbi:hypothetical protein LTR36_007232 [Oleoguttula mirabilis]|uniref:Mitochondrial distribution and morphology protein 12 n=1 Tax=Oleoguttula mirabilis TaxID=1507867 RepID=A0AAV9JA43_9PEZI|nr:hypothetical protein LTR36_007232 [Oleoguttula mirabilis]
MSVDIDWKTLTEGPDGAALAESIRAFVHERFQHIPLPRLIRSVKCHGFEFGTIAPQIVLKDICDPLPDFYENDAGEDDGSDGDPIPPSTEKVTERVHGASRNAHDAGHVRWPSSIDSVGSNTNSTLARGATPGILGGHSSLGYFHLPLSAGLSGTATPLAAVAGAQFQSGAHSAMNHHHHSESFSSISPPPSATPPSRPASRDTSGYFGQRHASAVSDDNGTVTPPNDGAEQERSPEDLQVVFRVTYNGNIRISMTAEVFLDYPMPSFVGIPLKLNITGLTFDGVGIVAYIKKRAHLCFLAPEDAEALVGGEGALDSPEEGPGVLDGVARSSRVGALLESIKIESEMGENDDGKQVLKNVGKIEKFVLEQVQRIFEDEFVYPSFWTFLV